MFYFIQVNIYAVLMYIIYLGLLRNRTGHSFNRVYLLLNAVAPILLPLIRLHINTLQVGNPVASVVLPVVDITNRSAAPLHTDVSAEKTLLIVYILLAALLITRFAIQVVRLRYFIKQRPAERWEDTKFIRNADIAPGSWLNYIFLPQGNVGTAILKHEQAHARLGHSYDLLLLRLLQCFFWPDIMLVLIIREIKIVHEFQADWSSAVDREDYIAAMLNDTFGTNTFSLSHTFFHHPIKRRIMMLQKTRKARMPYVLTTVLCLAIFSTIVMAQCAKPEAKSRTTQYVKNDSTYEYADKMPKPEFDMHQFMETNLHYPDSAKAKKIEGRVIAKFVVDEAGNVTNTTIINSPDTLLSIAALDVIGRMPKWTPGEIKGQKVKVSYVLPISFQLN